LYKTGRTFDVSRLREELTGWNAITHRTEHPASPHREVSDIWLRYNDYANYDGNMARFNAPHESVWYPIAAHMPEAKRISLEVADGHRLGAVLITRIRAGDQVYPHIDVGWHASFYEKFAVQIQGDERQSFHVEHESLITVTGDEFYFNNSKPHWVLNNSDDERITMIVCVRRD
jgi:uncharacterized RmlC-like cupin family protein